MSLNRHLGARLLWLPAVLAFAPFAFVACGGDDDDGGGGGGSDEAYVRDLCGAMATFEAEFNDLVADFDPSNTDDLDDFMNDAAEVVSNTVDDLDDANPPGDVEEVHQTFIDTLSQFRDALEDGDFDAIQNFDPPDVEPDPAVEDRLTEVAQDIEECQGLGLFDE